MKRILCISDSLGLPRPGVCYSQTWISMLRNQIPSMDFINISRRKTTTDMLSTWNYGEYLYFYDPAIVILQLGICDCAPRYMRTSSVCYRLLQKMPDIVQTFFWRIYKKFVKRSLKRTDVPLQRFENNLQNYIQQCMLSEIQHIICIKIITPGPAMLKSNPLIMDSVKCYNEVYDRLALQYPDSITVVDPLNISDDSFYVDGYHANAAGNKKIADICTSIIQTM